MTIHPAVLSTALLTVGFSSAPVAQETLTHDDPRSRAVLSLECATEIGRRDITLFANGTVRLRRRTEAERQMHLAELERADLDSYLRRLAAEDLSEAESVRYGPTGDWVEQCTLRLELPGSALLEFRYAGFDSLGLRLDHVVKIAEELGRLAIERDSETGLPYHYKARRGDVLVRTDGALFEVIGKTGDGSGVELRGIDQPLTLYLLEESLPGVFIRLEERSHPLFPGDG